MANIASRFAALFIALAASAALAAPAAPPAGAADAAVIPFTPDRWTLSEGIKVVEHRGVQAIEIPRLPTRPEAVLKGLTFTNGTIEVDVEGTTGLGPSIGFHRRDSRHLRAVLRPAATRLRHEAGLRPVRAGDEERAAVGHLSRPAGGRRATCRASGTTSSWSCPDGACGCGSTAARRRWTSPGSKATPTTAPSCCRAPASWPT